MNVRNFFRGVMLVATLCFAVACGKPQEKSTQPGKNNTSTPFTILEQTAKDLRWKGALSLSPMPVQSGKETIFTLKLTDPQGRPLEGARVSFGLIMPLMNMGKNTFEATPAQNGTYIGTRIFPMNGIWIVQASIDTGQQKTRMEFEIHTNEP
jgi:nitrogen fixation protein FixH